MRSRKAIASVLFSIGVIALILHGQSPQLPPLDRSQFPKDNPSEAMFLLLFGAKAGNAQELSGAAEIDNGEIESMYGYKFDVEDKILPPNKWKITARIPPDTKRHPGEPTAGIVLTLLASPASEVRVSTSRGAFAFKPSAIAVGSSQPALDGEARIVRLPVTRQIGSAWWEDDYPSIAADRQGGLWVVWTGYHNDRDEVGLRYYKDRKWSNYMPVPGNYGDVWWPQVVVDNKDNPWVVLAQQDKGNWDLYAAGYDKSKNLWSDIERITDDPGSDTNHQVAMDPAGNLYVTWQGFRGKTSDILVRVRKQGVWSPPSVVAHAQQNNWEPALALDSSGRAWIAWDTYRNGNYDVYLRSYKDGKLSDEIPVATTPRFDARASVVVDRKDRVWVAWEQGDVNWGKDVGFTNPAKYQGAPLGGRRRLRVAVYANGKFQAPAQQPDETPNPGSASYQPRLFLDGNGNVGILFNRSLQRYENDAKSYWEQQLTFYQGDKWSTPVPLPISWDRPTTRGQVTAAADGTLWAVYATDNRSYIMPLRPVRSTIYAAHMPSLSATEAALGGVPLENFGPASTHPDESGDLRAVRGYRTKLGRQQLQIVRGDTHRHTVLSWDGKITDGSEMEFFRYMMDAAAMDWGMLSDHQGGGSYYDYYWWLCGKLTDMYFVPESYTSLFGYERSMVFPDGHRNVVSATRSLRVLPFLSALGKMKNPGEVPPGSPPAVENDVKYLYKYLHRNGAISIPHTSGTPMGTDWRDNDPMVEPVVEIFQGARTSYEQVGAPLSAKSSAEKAATGGYEPAGYVNNAWAKGYRLGVISSSDHSSTHMSYAMVYTKDRSRQGIIDAIKQRHTYGATDNIVLDYRMGEHFMGDDFEAAGALPITIYVRGTKPIAALHIIRDQKIIHSVQPGVQEKTITFRDNSITRGEHYYYVRVEQEDGQVAWSSPIWVTYR